MNAPLRQLPAGHEVYFADPFFTGPKKITVPEFGTIDEMVNFAIVSGRLPPEVKELIRVYIGGHEIERRYWSNIRPKAGTNISLIATPLGGSSGTSKILSTVAMIAVVVLTWWCGGGALAGSWLASTSGFSFAAGSSSAMIAALGVSLVGGVVLNALFGADSKTSTRYTIDGAGNQPLEKYKSVPIVLGRRRIYPRLAATTWTECHDIDDDGDNYQYLNLLLFWSVGKVGYTDLKIGETPITDYDDYELYDCLESTALPANYSKIVREDKISAELRYSDSDGWVQRRTRTRTTKIEVVLGWPSGCYGMNMKNAFGVDLQMQYRSTDSSKWLDAPTGGTFTVKKKTSKVFYKKYSWAVAEGQYDIRIRRTNGDDWGLSDTDRSKRNTTVYWLLLHSFGDGKVITNPGNFSITGLRIRANNQINGTLENINAVVTSVVPKWNNGKFDDNYRQESRNPAELFHWYATSNVTALPQTGKIDTAALGAWAEECKEKGWYCDYVAENVSMQQVLHILAASGQGFGAVWEDGLLSVAVDDEKAAPVQIFSARNVRNFSGSIAFPDEIHAVNVIFADNTDNYNSQTRTVYATGYSAKNATLFETVELPYKCDPTEAYIFGWRYMAARTLRPESYSFDTWTEGLVVRYGCRADVAHWRMSVGIQGSRIRSLGKNDSGMVSAVTMDDEVTMDAGTSYVLRVQNGSTITNYNVVTVAGTSATLNLETPVTVEAFGTGAFPCIFGVSEKETLATIVVGIDVHDDKSSTLTCVPYAPDMLANGGDIPDWDPEITSRQTTKTSSGRALADGDQDALTDQIVIETAAAVAVVQGDVEQTTSALDSAISEMLDTSTFAAIESIVATLAMIDASNYDQVQRLTEKIFIVSAQAAASIEQTRTVALNATDSVADLATLIETNYGSVTALITQEAQTRASADQSLSTTINNLTSAYQVADASLSGSITSNTTSITQEAQTRASADQSLSTTINNLTSAYQVADASLSGSITSNTAYITQEAQTRASADSTISDALTQVATTVGKISASGYLRMTATQDTSSASVTVGLAAVVSSDTSSAVAALLLHADETGSYVEVQAGYFYVLGADGTKTAVFNSDGTLNVKKLVVEGSLLASVINTNSSLIFEGETLVEITSCYGLQDIYSVLGKRNCLQLITTDELETRASGKVSINISGLIESYPLNSASLSYPVSIVISRYVKSTNTWTSNPRIAFFAVGKTASTLNTITSHPFNFWTVDKNPVADTVKYMVRVVIGSEESATAVDVKIAQLSGSIFAEQTWM